VLEAAVEFARAKGATIVEGYPQELKAKLPPAFVWTGVLPAFVHAGFEEVARRSATKPIVRRIAAQTRTNKNGAKK
jgi:hypothetical protein